MLSDLPPYGHIGFHQYNRIPTQSFFNVIGPKNDLTVYVSIVSVMIFSASEQPLGSFVPALFLTASLLWAY